MTRIARIVAPGLPHHVTQRGNHRAAMFFESGDYRLYRDLLAAETRAAHVAVWAWVLMPNHVHLILVPTDETGLAGALGRVHRRYAAYVNARARRTGHLVQERFGSVVMDEAHLMAGLALCGAESGAGEAGGEGRGLAVVKCCRAIGPGG